MRHHIIYVLRKGRMVQVNEPLGNPDRANFVIVCKYGDWSGFLTLGEAITERFADLEQRGKPDDFFMLVER